MPDMNGWEATRLRNDCFCLIGLLLSVAVFIMSVLACMTCFLSDDKPMPPASPSNNPKVPKSLSAQDVPKPAEHIHQQGVLSGLGVFVGVVYRNGFIDSLSVAVSARTATRSCLSFVTSLAFALLAFAAA